MTKDISAIRTDFSKKELSKKEVSDNPIEQFKIWLEESMKAELLEPTAMILGTSDLDGNVTQRTVLLKAYDNNGFVFFTNYNSRKSKQIGVNPNVSLLFPWYGLERQVSITGIVEKVSNAQSIKYFLTRPRGSQLGAWISNQSSVITSRSILETKLEEMKAKFGKGEIPLPDFWGGYRVKPISIEFWQGRANRLHDRVCYTLENEDWGIERLAP
ncbi:MAG: pyridoxamine 5'-phosphate oxidase [Cytophagales bacterium]|nr:pyridoxamine 5'-phosphate oxidase [Cytophagales bacterium]